MLIDTKGRGEDLMKKFSTWLIVLGVIIILVPIVGAVYTNYQQDKLYEEYMNSQELENSIHDLDSAFSENQTTPAAVASPEAVTPDRKSVV